MAAARRAAAPRKLPLPDGDDVRLPPLHESRIPAGAVVYKTRIHEDVIAQLLAGAQASVEFDDAKAENGIFIINGTGSGHLLEAQPEPDKSGVNPMDVVFSMANGGEPRCTGKIYKTLDFDRRKVKTSARRTRTSPPQFVSATKKRSEAPAQSPAPKRQRTAPPAPLRSSRPVSALNGIGAPAPLRESPAKLPGLRSSRISANSPSKHPRPPRSSHFSPSYSSSPNSPGAPRAPDPAQRLDNLRRGMVHFLALGDATEASLKKRLLDLRESPSLDPAFRKILRQVGRFTKGTGFSLREEHWREVSDNFALYSEADRKRVRDLLARRSKRKSTPVGNGLRARSSLTALTSVVEAPIIVNDDVSYAIIAKALAQFDARHSRNGPIRDDHEEQTVHSYWDAWHSVYNQMHVRMERMSLEMEKLGKRYDEARSSGDRANAEKAIEKFHEASFEQHSQYKKYLPLLHAELKSLLRRMRAYSER